VAVWNRTQISYNLLLAPLARFAAFPRQEQPTSRGVFLFGDIMGKIKFTPSNEMETREWFAAHIADFDYNIIKSRTGFPDYILEDSSGNEVKAEIEFTSDNFILHGHNPAKCDLVICWSHTQELPLPVLELHTRFLHEPNSEATSPKEIKRTFKVKEVGLNRTRFREALSKSPQELEDFILAFVTDISARKRYLELIYKSRAELIGTANGLVKSLRVKGSNCEFVHPYDLFKLIASEYKQLNVGDLRFLKIADESVISIGEMIGEDTRDLHT
jgi:hypothetical protein